ncbi:MAG: hypothetical protein ACTSO5_12935 [Candidatus Heimdallarchaeaceae archaeon]
MVGHGKLTFSIEWNGLTGSFYGHINGKKVAGIMEVKMVMQGVTGDFVGWKLFGLVEILNAGQNTITGTFLIPN